jgi:hypothetical protein
VPVLVTRTIMDMAGITPEEDIQEEGVEPAEETPAAEIEGGEERLSIFEDFFDKLDLEDDDKDEGDEEEKD